MTAHYLMIGGFLGAGKTTAILRAGEHLAGRGFRVGAIMNDQSDSLVDTALVRSRDVAVEEIAGGCFCCRFNSLVDAAARLDHDTKPDVILAEPVGSCTDLVATVALPLRQMYGSRYRVAPLSVVVDPDRALRVLGLEPGRSFSPKVHYVYGKQLEEADILVVNKIDTAAPERVAAITSALEARYPAARVMAISARTGEGVAAWLDALLTGEAAGRVLDIDYDTYADGEALLAWLNCTAAVRGETADADTLLLSVVRRIHADLAAQRVEVAHLKATLAPTGGPGIAVVNAVRTDAEPALAFALDAPLAGGELTLNLRAETEPARLEQAVRGALAEVSERAGVRLEIDHLERFRPERPVPTHRITAGLS